MFACVLADIVQSFAGAEPVIMGDVTYGACCIGDLSAKELGCDFMVHYGHSCLIPVDVTSPLPVLYVFVEISFDMDHLVQCVVQTLPPHRSGTTLRRLLDLSLSLRTIVLPCPVRAVMIPPSSQPHRPRGHHPVWLGPACSQAASRRKVRLGPRASGLAAVAR